MKKNSIAEDNPDLAAQWHPTRNGSLTPADITPGSRFVAWWNCGRGHEWPAPVGRRRRHGCPFCAGRRLSPEHSLAARHPDLAAEWHPIRNALLKPESVSCGSRRTVCWCCPHGHEWTASVQSRVSGRGCPYCSGRKVAPERSLEQVRPDLAAEWQPERNGSLTPADVLPGSTRKVWWRCRWGHEWEASVAHRTRGTGCPYCAGRRLSAEHNLAAQYPDLAAEWHPTRNRPLTPAEVLPGANRKVWWQCRFGHVWKAAPNMRTLRGTGCPVCSGQKVDFPLSLAAIFPDLAAEWHPELNPRQGPAEISPDSRRRVWWRCPRGHAYQTAVRNKVRDAGCPHCLRPE